jgi:glycogen synthase
MHTHTCAYTYTCARTHTCAHTHKHTHAGHAGPIAAHNFKFSGIRNGIDPDLWDTETNMFLETGYDAEHVVEVSVRVCVCVCVCVQEQASLSVVSL